ncbi:hypothetical protein [Herbidospora sp. RD11066]
MNQGSFLAAAGIECWKGTLDELMVAIRSLPQAIGVEQISIVRAWISWTSGQQEVISNIDSLNQRLEGATLEEIFSLRVEVASSPQGISGLVVARQRIPGLLVNVNGNDQAKVLGVTQLVFQEMMIGYVDRMGGWRAPIWILLSLAPMMLVSFFIQENAENNVSRSFLVIASAASAIMILGLGYRMLQHSIAFTLVQVLPRKRGSALLEWAIKKYRIPAIKWLAGLVGVILVGIATNKIADWIPWP